MATSQVSSDSERSLAALKTATDATISLLNGCLELVAAIVKSHRDATNATSSPTPLTTSQPNTASIPPESYADPISAAHSASLLVRANSTKIALLLLNPPFTPSALATVVKEIGGGAIPSLAAAAQQLGEIDQQPTPTLQQPRYHYTLLVRKEFVQATWRLLEQLRLFLREIPTSKRPTAAEQAARKDAVGASTGLLWSACDRVSELSRPGGVGPKEFLIKTVDGYAALMRDTLEELKEWGEEVSEDEESDDDDDSTSEAESARPKSNGSAATATGSSTTIAMEPARNKHDAAQSLADALFASHGHIPRSDPDQLRPRLALVVRRLRLCTLLCAAVVKRRLKPLPIVTSSSSAVTPSAPWLAHVPTVARLDAGLASLARTRDAFDECAAALYELDPVAVDNALEAARENASEAAEVFGSAWEWEVLPGTAASKEDWRERDEFASWAERFVGEVGQAAA